MRKAALPIWAALSICLWLSAGTAFAQQSYPSRPIQIIIPFAAGGSIDITFRLLAPLLSKELGQSVVVVNRPGGAATIGMNEVAKSAPDGYTLGAASFSFAVDPSLLKNMPYDPLTDFAPITMVSRSPTLLLVNPKTPAHTVQQFIDWVKSKPPGSLNYGSVGVGSSGQLFAAFFLSRAGLQMVHVPSTNGAFASVAEGLTQLLFGPIPSSMPWLHDGRLRAIAVTSLKPDPSVPNLPTVAQTLPGFQAFEWPSLVAPKGTPQPIIDRIRQAVVLALADANAKKRLFTLGSEPVGSTPEQLHNFIADQIKTWATVVKQVGLKPQ
jgi:tripartite-type tricarboxylate transporter receptor subunit TctC